MSKADRPAWAKISPVDILLVWAFRACCSGVRWQLLQWCIYLHVRAKDNKLLPQNPKYMAANSAWVQAHQRKVGAARAWSVYRKIIKVY